MKALGESISFHWHARQALLGSMGLLGQAPRRQRHSQNRREAGTGHSGLRGFVKEGSLKQTWVVSSREPGRAAWVESGEYDLCPRHWESICTFPNVRENRLVQGMQ